MLYVNKDQVYPACIGLGRIGNYPNTVYTLWNDMSSSRPVPLWLRLVPMRFIGWNSYGSYLKWKV
ncbi:MAG: hypothetical protein CMA64_00410 [Euryarchaeota archaeon]|nr:hypothetical protein [Euryarchaeota archaeon]